MLLSEDDQRSFWILNISFLYPTFVHFSVYSRIRNFPAYWMYEHTNITA
jgi:hypothetical protein